MKELEIDALLSYIKGEFNKSKDDRADNASYTMGDVLQSGLAIFSLKDSSLLDYNSQVASRVDNLRGLATNRVKSAKILTFGKKLDITA